MKIENNLGDIIEIELLKVFMDNKHGSRFPIAQLKVRLLEKFSDYLKKDLLEKIANHSHIERSWNNVHRVVQVEIVSNLIHEIGKGDT